MSKSDNKPRKLISYLQAIGMVLIIISSAGYFFGISVFKYVFAAGAILILLYQLIGIYSVGNHDMLMRRRNRLNLMLSLLLALAAYSMFDGTTLWMAIILIYALVTLMLSFRQ